MYSIQIKMSVGLESFFKKYPVLYETAKKKGISNSLRLLHTTSRKKAPHDKWKLWGEINALVPQKKLVAGTNFSRKYARIQDVGGTIYAKKAPYLTFKTRDGSWHRVKSVTIPAKHYFYRNAEEQKGKVLNQFVQSFREVFAKM